MDKNQRLSEAFESLDERIADLEALTRGDEPPELDPVLESAAAAVRDLLCAYAEHAGKPIPVTEDLLDILKAFVKGDPSLNAVRDNVREIVYYQNCIAMDRKDALPPEPQRMVAHTVRHLYLYLRSRSEQEHRLD